MIARYRPKHHRGQNFLTDRNVLNNIVQRARIGLSDTVVEIGAGTGNLTELLAKKANRVIAIEIDRDLIGALEKRCASYPTIEIVKDDARVFDPASYQLQPFGYLVVANIPYNITSMIIRKFLEESPRPSRMILLIQKEVAERICARPPHMSILALSVQYFATPKILFSVSRNSFTPKPAVDSAVIEIVLRNSCSSVSPQGHAQTDFFRLVTAGFSQKRKLLASNLAHSLGIPRENILEAFTTARVASSARAQELSLDQWLVLVPLVIPFTRL